MPHSVSFRRCSKIAESAAPKTQTTLEALTDRFGREQALKATGANVGQVQKLQAMGKDVEDRVIKRLLDDALGVDSGELAVLAVLMLLLGFTTGNRILMGVGLMALLAFVSRYYYYLQTSLLVKSMVLAVSGGLLLGARLVLHRMFPMSTKTEASHA